MAGTVKVTKYLRSVDPLLNSRGQANPMVRFEDSFIFSVLGNEEYLTYDYENNEWYFNLSAANGVGTLATLGDVKLTNLADDDVLVYDTTTKKWINSTSLKTATVNIASITQQIATINQTNIDQQTTINNIQTTTAAASATSAPVPVGGIIMWSGTTVPTGWRLCNGTLGTPDLVDRFIIGGNLTNSGEGGSGSPTSTTTVSQSLTIQDTNLPPHGHSLSGVTGTTNETGSHSHEVLWDGTKTGDERRTIDIQYNFTDLRYTSKNGDNDLYIKANGDHSHTVTLSDANTGNGPGTSTPLQISATSQPKKYYILAFIMYKPNDYDVIDINNNFNPNDTGITGSTGNAADSTTTTTTTDQNGFQFN